MLKEIAICQGASYTLIIIVQHPGYITEVWRALVTLSVCPPRSLRPRSFYCLEIGEKSKVLYNINSKMVEIRATFVVQGSSMAWVLPTCNNIGCGNRHNKGLGLKPKKNPGTGIYQYSIRYKTEESLINCQCN